MIDIISYYLYHKHMALNVTFRQLKVFDAVAQHLSYTRAAKALFLTQPAVSMQIKQLEDNVGLPLFEQLGKRIYLTEAGRELYNYSRAIAQQLDEADTVLEQLKGVKRGRLAVSVASTANYFATPWSNCGDMYRSLDRWIRMRLRCMKFKRKSKVDNVRVRLKHFKNMGLLYLSDLRPSGAG